ncbi:hypothetical protein [Burkholderia pyrrocinia]|uniref:hypothetical protein n=1 Tax=Burkholderia pyrrocinia TaxID=60550 RepID=UPI00158F265C|nr:hypothetical protein [Burkholderia pyrrocinia]
MSNKITGRFGGALDAALDEVVSTSASSISVADAGTREAFLDGWARTLSDHARYLKSTGASLAAPVVIVYVQDVGLFSEQNDWIKRSMLGSSTKDKFAGILAVASTEVGACVHPDDISDTLEIEANIRLANLQESPTIALVSESKLLIWPGGLDGSLKSFERELDGNAVVVNLDSIDAELNRFYEKVGRQTKKWWKGNPPEKPV